MKKLLQAVLWFAIIAAVLTLLHLVDPLVSSKVHGPLMSVLAGIFLIQDAVFWLFHRKLDDLKKAVPIGKSESMFWRAGQLKAYAWKLLALALVSRVILLICGQFLQNADLDFRVLRINGSDIIGSQIIGAVGYCALVAGFFITIKTYALFLHVESVSSEMELRERQRTEGESQAKKILGEVAVQDWHDDPSLSSYPKTKLKSLPK